MLLGGEALFSLKDYVFKTQGIKKLFEFFILPPKIDLKLN